MESKTFSGYGWRLILSPRVRIPTSPLFDSIGTSTLASSLSRISRSSKLIPSSRFEMIRTPRLAVSCWMNEVFSDTWIFSLSFVDNPLVAMTAYSVLFSFVERSMQAVLLSERPMTFSRKPPKKSS